MIVLVKDKIQYTWYAFSLAINSVVFTQEKGERKDSPLFIIVKQFQSDV